MISPSRSAVGSPGHWPQERGVAEQRRRVHVGDDERLLGGGERRGRRRMGVDDRRDVAARAVDPQVKARRRIRLADAERTRAVEHVQRVVDQQPRRLFGLVEREAERQGPEGARRRAARGQLAGEAGLVAFVGEDPGAARQRVARVRDGSRRFGPPRGHRVGDRAVHHLPAATFFSSSWYSAQALAPSTPLALADLIQSWTSGSVRLRTSATKAGLASMICDVRDLQRLEAALVGGVPRLAGEPRERFARDRQDRVLVLLRQLVPLVLVHEEAERRRIEAAGEVGRVLDDLVEVERLDRLGREEGAVGDAGRQQLVRLGRRLDQRRRAERLGRRPRRCRRRCGSSCRPGRRPS